MTSDGTQAGRRSATRARMQALGRGWHEVGKPATNIFIKTFFTARLDLALALGMNAVAPGGLGIALSRMVRLVVAARVARSQQAGPEEQAEEGRQVGNGNNDARNGDSGDGSSGSSRSSTAPAPPAGGAAAAAPPAGPKRRPVPKGLGAIAPLPLPRIPPGGLACCSTQPLGLPMLLIGQSATRGPMYAVKGDRLIRGLAGLAASFLLCRAVRTPFTGRRARLPPRAVEFLFSSLLGPAAAVSYLGTSAAGQAGGRADAEMCKRVTPALQQLYGRLRGAGEAEAKSLGRPVVFAGSSATAEAIPRSDINACCLPGGIVFVHSGLIKAVNGRQDSLSFVLGHEVGHAVGRHSLEKATSTYRGMFVIDTLIGLAGRVLKSIAPGADDEWVAGRLKTLDGVLQSGLYLMQMGQSRRHEYEADQLALHLGGGAGMDRRALFSGAEDVLHKFMKMEAGSAGGGLPVPVGAPRSDSPMSTHPAAVNRLRRLTRQAAYGA